MIHSKRRTVFSTVVVSLRNDDGVISGISLSSVLALFPTAMLKTRECSLDLEFGLSLWSHNTSGLERKASQVRSSNGCQAFCARLVCG
jgi:hypothetical protein